MNVRGQLKTARRLGASVHDYLHPVQPWVVLAGGHFGKGYLFAHTLRLVCGNIQRLELERLGTALAIGLGLMHRKIQQHPLGLGCGCCH